MVTRVERLEKQMVVKVLSPPCGMVTERYSSSSPCSNTVWDGESTSLLYLSFVLSPPCGMVTTSFAIVFSPRSLNKFVGRQMCSKPTVWDGDSLVEYMTPPLRF
jgi:hypothetical protein